MAQAQVDCRLLQKVDFEEPVQAIQDLQMPVVMVASSIRMHLPEGDGDPDNLSRFSGTYISDSGTILTGSHCLDHCRFEADGRPKGGTPVKFCKIEIDGKLQDFEILKAASCPTTTKMKFLLQKSSGLSTEKFPENCKGDNFDDAAVIRPLHPELLSPYTCVNISEEKHFLGQKVFAMSYPNPTQRAATNPGAKDAIEHQLSLSRGEVMERATCQKVSSVAQNIPLSPGIEMMRPRMIQTSVDLVRGSSGSGLINARGEIVGVASFVDNKSQDEANECKGATFFQPVLGLKKELGESAGSCKRRDANRGRSI